ncbi:hypothetical protein Cgig2_001728 [Carnegiea gigantea]|uniref:Uncharacterized protein n=1 Tax=Carnegiea gigantea TaxID=171969 RepID=A0A9Q1JM86_9CARY|nr:hypothetical protein Cgig2_001728 [Carnegiea gigantea]
MSNCQCLWIKYVGDEDSMHHRYGEKETPCIIDVRREVSGSVKRISLRGKITSVQGLLLRVSSTSDPTGKREKGVGSGERLSSVNVEVELGFQGTENDDGGCRGHGFKCPSKELGAPSPSYGIERLVERGEREFDRQVERRREFEMQAEKDQEEGESRVF